MELDLVKTLFFVLAVALLGGMFARILKIQPLIGYIVAGVISASFLSNQTVSVARLSEIGTILLLFSVGMELSLVRLKKVLRVATLGALTQIILVTALGYLFLSYLGFNPVASLILSAGFSLSSTAVVVKILAERGESDTLHGEVMIGWLLVQDLAVIPMMVIMASIANPDLGNVFATASGALVRSILVVGVTILLGKLVAPFLIHRVAALNSRELLVLVAVSLALGTAVFTSFLGISAPLGAFLAGVVISESQENHAVFAETRPLRDLFVALFFVSLGFFVIPSVVLPNLGIILALAAFILVLKFLVVFFVSILVGYHGKTALASAFGLSQVGEFAFIVFSQASVLGILSPEMTAIGVGTTLLTLIITPFLFKSIVPSWRWLRAYSSRLPLFNKFLLGWNKRSLERPIEELSGHIIIVGFGRVGKWVGKALAQIKAPFVVIEYDQSIVGRLRREGVLVIYGDPTASEVLKAARIEEARVIIIAIPDRMVAEEMIAQVQTAAPNVKIITRAHFDEDWEKLKTLKVDKIIQPEFEAALAVIRTLMVSMGKSKEEIRTITKNLRLSKAFDVSK